jgi:hypothetical protein
MNFLWQVASIMFDTQLFAMKFFKDQEPWEKEVSALRTIQGDVCCCCFLLSLSLSLSLIFNDHA